MGLTLLFDFDGTLVHQNRPEAYRALVEKYSSINDPNFAELLYQTDKELCEKGEYNRVYVFSKHTDKFGHLSPEQLCQAFWERVCIVQTISPMGVETLAKLSAQGHNLICVTDTDGTGGNKLKRIEATGLAIYFQRIFIGMDNVPWRKGRPEYLEWVVKEINAKPAQCVMIGDKVAVDLVPAKAIGMSSILVKNEEYPGTWPIEVKSLPELVPQIERLRLGVFISYSSRDREFVEKLDSRLQELGIRPWRDIRDLHVGQNVYATISEAIRTQPIFLIVITKQSINSRWVREELETALHNRVEGKKEIFPVVAQDISDDEIPHELQKLKWADFRSDFEAGMFQIESAIKVLREHLF